MPKFYKGEWVHFVHFNQFPVRQSKRESFGKKPLPPKTPRELSLEEKKHREQIHRLFKDYDEWSEEEKGEFFKNDQ